ncbi:MAG TPA: gluconate 2-dehydrogenase subunit 3 family protein [Acidobacteriaceae bacterium]|nr:gluconate 2-dehydrogenase subunit 3 family protein [Acidobacteriaceae bacterium]
MKKTYDVDSSLLPRDPSTGESLPPRRTPGYYPGFSTLSQSPFWDDATRRVVTDRVDSPPSLKFFSGEEFKFWTVVFAHLVPQTDRTPDRQIPLVAPLDHRLYINQTVGYRYDTMPQDRDAYRFGREALNKEALQQYRSDFLSLPYREQDLVLKAIHDGKPQAAQEIWSCMSVHRFWQLLMGDAIDAYYAHPWAWDEIGFGGPAYPRAYTRLERGEPEPWEVAEKRHEWLSPEAAVSHEAYSAAHLHTEADQHKLTEES